MKDKNKIRLIIMAYIIVVVGMGVIMAWLTNIFGIGCDC